MNKNYIAIIPARGGSKGLKRKNILPFNGKPLISWSIDFIKKSGIFDKCFTSTDSEEIAFIAKKYGSDVPFLRSKELASDSASSCDVILDVISKCNLNKDDIFFLFEPTSPYRKISYLNSMIELYEGNKTKCAVSVYEASSKSYVFQYKINDLGKLVSMDFNKSQRNIYRRQDVSPTYLLDGAFYSSSVENFINTESFVSSNSDAIKTDFFTSLGIDSLEEFQLLELLFKRFGSPF